MTKRWLSLLVVLVLLMPLFAVPAYAATYNVRLRRNPDRASITIDDYMSASDTYSLGVLEFSTDGTSWNTIPNDAALRNALLAGLQAAIESTVGTVTLSRGAGGGTTGATIYASFSGLSYDDVGKTGEVIRVMAGYSTQISANYGGNTYTIINTPSGVGSAGSIYANKVLADLTIQSDGPRTLQIRRDSVSGSDVSGTVLEIVAGTPLTLHSVGQPTGSYSGGNTAQWVKAAGGSANIVLGGSGGGTYPSNRTVTTTNAVVGDSATIEATARFPYATSQYAKQSVTILVRAANQVPAPTARVVDTAGTSTITEDPITVPSKILLECTDPDAAIFYIVSSAPITATPTTASTQYTTAGIPMLTSGEYYVKAIAAKGGSLISNVLDKHYTSAIKPTDVAISPAGTLNVSGQVGYAMSVTTIAPDGVKDKTPTWKMTIDKGTATDADDTYAELAADGKLTIKGKACKVEVWAEVMGITSEKTTFNVTTKPITGIVVTPNPLTIAANTTGTLSIKPLNSGASDAKFTADATAADKLIIGFDTDEKTLKGDGTTVFAVRGLTPGNATLNIVCGVYQFAVNVVVTADAKTLPEPVFDPASQTTFDKPDSKITLSTSSMVGHLAWTITDKSGTTSFPTSGAQPTSTIIQIPNNETITVVAWTTKNSGVAGEYEDSAKVTRVLTSKIAATGVKLYDSSNVEIKTAQELNGTDAATIKAVVQPVDAAGASLVPDAVVTWSSSAAERIKVEADAAASTTAKVTGITGEADITATVGTGISAKATFKVKDVPLTGIRIQYADTKTDIVGTISVAQGEYVALSAALTPPNATGVNLVWTSADPLVASVENGKLIGLDSTKGTTIKVSSGTVSSAIYNVIVGAASQKVADIAVTPAPTATGETKEITITAKTATIGAVIYYSLTGTPTTADTPFPAEGLKLHEDKTVYFGAFLAGKQPSYATHKYTFKVPATKVTITPAAADVIKGDTLQLNAALTPEYALDKAIAWTSSDPTTAKVDAKTGLVTALKPGKATITATVANTGIAGGIAVSATSVITVKDVTPTKVTVTPASASLTIGDKINLGVAVEPFEVTSKEATWKSSNAAVATVSSTGAVTAIAAGTTTITATVGGLEGKCEVTVEADPATPPVSPTKVPTFNETGAGVFEAVENSSLSVVLGKFSAGAGETLDQIRYYYNFIFTNNPGIGSGVTYSLAKDGTLTMNIADVGSSNVAFTVNWGLLFKSGIRFGDRSLNPSADVTGTFYGPTNRYQINIVAKPTLIQMTKKAVEAIEMKDNETKSGIIVGTVTNYDAFVKTGVALNASVSGLAAATAKVNTNGDVEVTITNPPVGEYPELVVTLSAKGCDNVKADAFKVTVTKGTPIERPAIATNVRVKVGPKASNISNSDDVTFILENVPAGAAVEWSSSKPAVIAIDKTTGKATLGKTKKQLNKAVVISAKYDGQTYQKTYKLRNAPTNIKALYKNGNKWVSFDVDRPLTLKPNATRVIKITGPTRLLAKQAAWMRWTATSTDMTVAKVGKALKKVVAGATDGAEAIITFETFNGVKLDVKVIINAAKGLDSELDEVVVDITDDEVSEIDWIDEELEEDEELEVEIEEVVDAE